MSRRMISSVKQTPVLRTLTTLANVRISRETKLRNKIFLLKNLSMIRKVTDILTHPCRINILRYFVLPAIVKMLPISLDLISFSMKATIIYYFMINILKVIMNDNVQNYRLISLIWFQHQIYLGYLLDNS